MRLIATDVARSVWFVCLCVGHTGELCNNGRTDPDAVWGLTDVGPRNRVSYWGPDSPRERALLGDKCEPIVTCLRMANVSVHGRMHWRQSMMSYCGKLTGEDLLCYLNTTESVGLRKADCYSSRSAI